MIKEDIFGLTAADLTPYDVVVNAFNATFGTEEQHTSAGHVLIEVLKGHTNTRLAIVAYSRMRVVASGFVNPQVFLLNS